MFRRLLSVGIVFLLPTLTVCGQDDAGAKGGKAALPALKSVREQASYAIGVNIGRSLTAEEADVDAEVLIQGLRDVLSKKKKLVLTDDEMEKAFASFSKEIQAKAAEKAKVAGEKAKKDGEAFLAENKKKKGVTTTKTGLQYKILKTGDGASPKKTSTVKVHYHGTLIDGTVFDSSVETMEPAEFPVDRVIPGWTEALLGMKVGDKWQIFIPAELAYGDRGTPGGPIPPNAVLVFEVELLGIVK